MKVEELDRYGKTLTGVPKEAMRKQRAIVFRRIREKFGLSGMLPFLGRVFLEKKALIKKHPDAYRQALHVGEEAAKEFPMLAAMFNVVARKEGKKGRKEPTNSSKGSFKKLRFTACLHSTRSMIS